MKSEHTTATLTEITLLNEKNECLHLEKRVKECFDYPLHKHKEMEMNFVENCEGVMRIVGDSVRETGFYDLAIIGSGLEHEWAQPQDFVPHTMSEITIHFSPSMLGDGLLGNQYFTSLRLMLQKAQRGICFGQQDIIAVKDKLWELAEMEPGFDRFMLLLDVLHTLSGAEDIQMLASEEFSNSNIPTDSQRIRLATEYIHKHFKEEIRLQDLADLVCMTPTAFSRFFSLRTHKSVSDYIIDHRIGYAARQLIDGVQTVIEICYDSGFNNVSNFNRLFRKRKGYTPTQYRKTYLENKKVTPKDKDSKVKLI